MAGLAAGACTELQTTSEEAAARLADLRAELDEVNFLVAYQKKRKEEAVVNGENPDRYDNAAALQEEERFKQLWKKQKDATYESFLKRYRVLADNIVAHCLIEANSAGATASALDACVDRTKPEERYDPIKSAAVGFALVILLLVAMVAYRQGRKRLDPVALAATQMGLTVHQGTRSTELKGSYKGRALRVESAAPEADGGDKYVRVEIGGLPQALLVRFGPLAPPTGLAIPDLDAPEVEDSRLPIGYKLRLSEGASAEELLGGDIGFQIREFDPVDVRVYDGLLHVTTWMILSKPEQVVELVDLCLVVADVYKS